MGRKLMPEGRRTVVGVRLSDAEAGVLDSVRGDVPRAEWAYRALMATLGQELGFAALSSQRARDEFARLPPVIDPPVINERRTKPVRRRKPVAAAPAAALLARDRSEDQREAEKPPLFPCCRHCHHGGAKGHGYACTRC